MKLVTKVLYFNIVLFMLAGCAGNTNEELTDGPSENSTVMESTEEDTTITDEYGSTSVAVSGTADTYDHSSAGKVKSDSDLADDKKDKVTRFQYSSEEIEFARIWLQLGANQDLDGLYVRRISAGEPLNPNDDTSASYPEAVVQLAGSRLVDGSVTYSGNGDGTINVYNVPLRWDGIYPAGEEFYQDIIENTKLVYVNPGADVKIVELIKKLKDNG